MTAVQYAPWNSNFIQRKNQIQNKVSDGDKTRGWGIEHFKDVQGLDIDYLKVRQNIRNLYDYPNSKKALEYFSKCSL